MDIRLAGQTALLTTPPETAFEAGAALAPVFDKQGRDLSALAPEISQAPGKPVIILPLAMEDAAFLEAVLQYAAQWVAAGLRLAARACNADELILYTTDESLSEALRALVHEPKLTVIMGEGSPVLREESALYAAMEGKPVRCELMEKCFPTQGYQGRPTWVLDVESAFWLAAVSLGAAKTQGKLMFGMRMDQPEQGLFTLLNCGVTLHAASNAFGFAPVKPVLMGGITGRFVGAEALDGARIAYGKEHDTMRLFDASLCMAQTGRKLTADIEAASCGKCVLCREGSWQIAAVFSDIAAGRGKKADFGLICDIGELIGLGAFCDFGRDMVRPAVTLMETAREELEAHVVRRQCPTGRCTAFSGYVIDPGLCDACGDCIDACPEDAITGKPGFIHMTDDALCEKCGKCAQVCPTGAARASAGRMRLPQKLTRVGRFR